MTSRIKSTIAVGLIMASLTISGCTAPGPGTTTPADTTAADTTAPDTTAPDTTAPVTTAPQTSPATTGGQNVNYQILMRAPEGLKNSIEALKKDRGYFYFEEEKILVVLMGERATGGYALSLDQISAEDTTLFVSVVEKSPKPGDIVTQAFTYPMLILQLEDDFSDFQIKNQLGDLFQPAEGNLR